MSSITLTSCEVNNPGSEPVEFVREVDDFVSDLTSQKDILLEDAEVLISETVRSWEQRLLEMCASQQSSAQESEPVECPECQGACVPLRQRERNFTTLCGVIRVMRWVYCCDQGHRHSPWEAKQKLKGLWTHRVAERMCRLAALLDFREASEELSRQGIEVSHSALRQRVGEWAEELNVCEEVDPQKLEDNQRWYVSCDGCYTNSPEGWKEVKVGCIYRDYPQPVSGSTPSARTSSIRYVASRDDATHFGKALFSLATHSGIYREAIDTQEIVFIGDGAGWIWKLAEEHFPNAIEIVDHMHATSHLYTAAKSVFGETETEAVETWVETTKPYLNDGNITEVAASIRGLVRHNAEASEILEREARYFEKHAERMQYQKFREKGYQIGSGVIESACKHIVGERCKQASMRWEKPGINAVLKFRCLKKNEGSWNNYWYQNTKAA